MNYEEEVGEFKHYVKRVIDLMLDAYKWKCLSKEADNEEEKRKYMAVSDTLYDLFMKEHEHINQMFREE